MLGISIPSTVLVRADFYVARVVHSTFGKSGHCTLLDRIDGWPGSAPKKKFAKLTARAAAGKAVALIQHYGLDQDKKDGGPPSITDQSQNRTYSPEMEKMIQLALMDVEVIDMSDD